MNTDGCALTGAGTLTVRLYENADLNGTVAEPFHYMPAKSRSFIAVYKVSAGAPIRERLLFQVVRIVQWPFSVPGNG